MSTPTRRTFLRLAQGAIAAASIWAASADAQERLAVTVFENVRIFDGTHLSLSAPSNVLIRGNIIEQISTSPIPTDRRADTQIIAGGGRVLMPGLSDVHWHAMLVRPTPAQLLSSDIGYSTLLAGAEATATCAVLRAFGTWVGRSSPSSGRSTTSCCQVPASTLQALSSLLAAATEISVSSVTCPGPLARR